MTGFLKIAVTGATDQHGSLWVNLVQGRTTAWMEWAHFHDAGTLGKRLTKAGFRVAPGAEVRRVVDGAAAISKWPKRQIADRTGWHDAAFVLGDGTAITVSGGVSPVVVLDPDLGKWGQTGTVDGWRSEVAQAIQGQAVCQLAVMAAFAPPLLDLVTTQANFGIELVGEPGIGKSTLQKIVSSVWGGPGIGSAAKYWETWLTTPNAIETVAKGHSGCLLVLDEANLFAGGSAQSSRAQEVKDIVFRLAEGHGKSRFNEARPEVHRLIYLSSSNQSLADVLIGRSGASEAAALDRLLTIHADRGNKFGIFDRLPPQFASSREFASHIVEAAGTHYGVPIRAYLKALVKDRSKNEQALKARIAGYITEFRRVAKVDENNGSAVRLATRMG